MLIKSIRECSEKQPPNLPWILPLEGEEKNDPGKGHSGALPVFILVISIFLELSGGHPCVCYIALRLLVCGHFSQ